MQNVRQEKLLSMLLEREDWMTSRQLASLLGVSDRTIRSDIETVNKKITPAPIESHVRYGYRIAADARTHMQISEKKSHEPEIPQTPGARCIYIIQKLLFEVRELNLVSLQDQIYVSGYSIDNDIKRIRRMLEPYSSLKLVRSKECISLKGDELGKRRFYRDLLVAEVQDNFLNMNLLADLYKSFDLLAVKDIFRDVLSEYGYSIHESMFLMVLLHAATSIERINSANYVSMDNASPDLEDTIEYQISKTFYDRVSKRLHIRIHDGEIGMFALVIMGKRAASYTNDYVSFHGKWLNTKELVSEALEGIYSLFGLDFRRDADLIAGLKLHIHGLVDRVKANVHMQEVMAEEIRRKYPFIYEMGIYVLELLQQKLETPVAEAEACYIALHLGGASERANCVRKYKTVMIIPHNQTFSDMCVKKISEMFRERIEIAGVFHYFEEEMISSLAPDLLLTTFALEHKLDVPTVSINMFVDSATESGILQALNRLDKKRFHLELTSYIGNLMRREHFYNNVELKTPEEIIGLLCHGLEKEGIVEPEFKDIVLKREQMSPTSFADAFAIPHALGAFASNSTIAVAMLKNPVRWGNFHVSIVMLFATNEGDERMIKVFFDWVSDVMSHPEELAKLVSASTYEEFIDRMIG